MTHLDLDTQPEAVRQFVLTLATATDGVVLESAGRPVVCVVRPPVRAAGTGNEAWTEQKNQRRCALIDRMYEHGLAMDEEAELALLQDEMDRHLDRVAPLPLGPARALHQRLLEKATRPADGTQS